MKNTLELNLSKEYMNSFIVLFQVETLDSPAFECSVLLTATERVKNVVFQENPP